MKKVAHTALIYFRLSENWIHTQIKYLKGWESMVLANRTENLDTITWKPSVYAREDELPFVVRAADSLVMLAAGYYPSFYYRAKKENVDLVHAHFGPMGYLSSALVRAIDVPLVTTFYGYDASMLPKEGPKWRGRYKVLFERGSRFLVEGPAMKDKLKGLGCPPEKIIIQHLGIELEKYPVRDNYHTDGKLRILMVGRFVEKKGFIYGLRAFRKFLDGGGEGILTIIGDSSGTTESEAIKKQLLQYVEENDLDTVVKFKGLIPLKELQKEYYRHELFLAPSVEAQNGDNEGGAPVTIIEAEATGMPIIGSRHCDIPEVVKEDETGLLANERDVEELTEHLFQMYHHPAMRAKLGRAGARYIRANFDAQKQGKRLGKIYDNCLQD